MEIRKQVRLLWLIILVHILAVLASGTAVKKPIDIQTTNPYIFNLKDPIKMFLA